MDLLKKHYEKIILGLVLLLLVVGAAMLPIMINKERDELNQRREAVQNPRVKPIDPLDLSTNEARLKQVKAGYNLDLAVPHKAFNPALWQEAPDGHLIKVATGREIGIDAVTVTNLRPLNLIVKLESIRDTGTNFTVSVARGASAKVDQRRPRMFDVWLGKKTEVFTLREVGGTPQTPELVIEMSETQERITVSKDKPFSREDGYMASLRYAPENRTWADQRVGSKIKIGNESYIIVAIQKNEIVFSAESNQKKTRIPISVVP